MVGPERVGAVLAPACLAVCLAGALLGCSDPLAEARDRLPPGERARFDAGRQVAGPCFSCHDVTGEGQHIGPPLRGLFGRKVGGAPGFAYSEAMRAEGGVWDGARLRAFLTDVQGSIPGNRMVSPSVPAGAPVESLLVFLRAATRRP